MTGSFGRINESFELNESNSAYKQTTNEIIRDAIFSYSIIHDDFAASDIEKHIENLGKKLAVTQPKIRISMVLKELADKKYLAKTFRGKGSVPHRYRVTDPGMEYLKAETNN